PGAGLRTYIARWSRNVDWYVAVREPLASPAAALDERLTKWRATLSSDDVVLLEVLADSLEDAAAGLARLLKAGRAAFHPTKRQRALARALVEIDALTAVAPGTPS